MWTRYTFICDPDSCDSLLELTWNNDNLFWPSGDMVCPCGRKMQWISEEEAIKPIITDVTNITPVKVVKIDSNPYN